MLPLLSLPVPCGVFQEKRPKPAGKKFPILRDLPPDVLALVLSELKHCDDVERACRTDKQLLDFCKNEKSELWDALVERRILEDGWWPKSPNQSSRDYFIEICTWRPGPKPTYSFASAQYLSRVWNSFVQGNVLYVLKQQGAIEGDLFLEVFDAKTSPDEQMPKALYNFGPQFLSTPHVPATRKIFEGEGKDKRELNLFAISLVDEAIALRTFVLFFPKFEPSEDQKLATQPERVLKLENVGGTVALSDKMIWVATMQTVPIKLDPTLMQPPPLIGNRKVRLLKVFDLVRGEQLFSQARTNPYPFPEFLGNWDSFKIVGNKIIGETASEMKDGLFRLQIFVGDVSTEPPFVDATSVKVVDFGLVYRTSRAILPTRSDPPLAVTEGSILFDVNFGLAVSVHQTEEIKRDLRPLVVAKDLTTLKTLWQIHVPAEVPPGLSTVPFSQVAGVVIHPKAVVVAFREFVYFLDARTGGTLYYLRSRSTGYAIWNLHLHLSRNTLVLSKYSVEYGRRIDVFR